MANASIHLLIVDDSALVRTILSRLFSRDADFSHIETAPCAEIALKKIQIKRPDVVTLDILMPGMDGLAFLEKVMQTDPLPVVMLSQLTKHNAPEALKALQLGAVDVVEKPRLDVRNHLEHQGEKLINLVKTAVHAKVGMRPKKVQPMRTFKKVEKAQTVNAVLAPPSAATIANIKKNCHIVAIGSSTGGPQALEVVLSALPRNSPGVVVVQHIPLAYSAPLAERLNTLCSMRVKHAEDGDVIQQGTILIAPGDRHMVVRKLGNGLGVRLDCGPLVNRHRPSVDVLFRSIACIRGIQSVGIILTGMGADGAQGLLEMKRAGALTIAQDEKSAVVYGMPKQAVELGAVDRTASLEDIPQKTIAALKALHYRPV
ncbi:protein-glutamate methylesterase/protein-glutamine glutaminase [Magnetococcales bacterium HHB-1]